MVEGSRVQGEEDWGESDTPQKKIKSFTSEGDIRRNIVTSNN